MDQIPEGVDSKFRFVLLAAQRAEQLMRGARSKVELGNRKPTVVAMREIGRGVVEWGYGPAPSDVGADGEAELGGDET